MNGGSLQMNGSKDNKRLLQEDIGEKYLHIASTARRKGFEDDMICSRDSIFVKMII